MRGFATIVRDTEGDEFISQYPFKDIPDRQSHVPPHFVIYDIGDKICHLFGEDRTLKCRGNLTFDEFFSSIDMGSALVDGRRVLRMCCEIYDAWMKPVGADPLESKAVTRPGKRKLQHRSTLYDGQPDTEVRSAGGNLQSGGGNPMAHEQFRAHDHTRIPSAVDITPFDYLLRPQDSTSNTTCHGIGHATLSSAADSEDDSLCYDDDEYEYIDETLFLETISSWWQGVAAASAGSDGSDTMVGIETAAVGRAPFGAEDVVEQLEPGDVEMVVAAPDHKDSHFS